MRFTFFIHGQVGSCLRKSYRSMNFLLCLIKSIMMNECTGMFKDVLRLRLDKRALHSREINVSAEMSGIRNAICCFCCSPFTSHKLLLHFLSILDENNQQIIDKSNFTSSFVSLHSKQILPDRRAMIILMEHFFLFLLMLCSHAVFRYIVVHFFIIVNFPLLSNQSFCYLDIALCWRRRGENTHAEVASYSNEAEF